MRPTRPEPTVRGSDLATHGRAPRKMAPQPQWDDLPWPILDETDDTEAALFWARMEQL